MTTSRRHKNPSPTPALMLGRRVVGVTSIQVPYGAVMQSASLLPDDLALELLLAIRPPVLTEISKGQYLVVANVGTYLAARRVHDAQHVRQQKIPCLVASTALSPTDWAVFEQAAVPLILGVASTREKPKALKRLKAAGRKRWVSTVLPREKLLPLLERPR